MTRHRPRGKGKGKRRDAPVDDGRNNDLLDKASFKNERFFAYYKAQKILPEEEWEEFLEAMRRPLPTTFRVAGSRQTAAVLNKTIEDVHVPSLSNAEFEGQKIPPPVQIPWYPDGLAWQFNVPKKVLRKQPEFKKFHSFLVFETEVGNISRQEGVSMIPPLFLDVEPHHKVMDMCAAPGSKTAQILEALHAQDTVTSSSIPSGLLVANDSDNKRTHLLIHQSARLPSPALMVTNLDASNYPSIKIPTPRGMRTLMFDRILCDVPCSGDGTMRKNIGIWKTWSPGDANGLHSLQVRILLRAMRLLNYEPSSKIVYSTCSLNPVENEAVVADALIQNPDFELMDVSDRFPQLIRRPGMTEWRPTTDRECETTFESYEEFIASSKVDEAMKAKLSRSHWPPDGVEKLNLPYCMRIYPHLQDSGGFFVAVLRRKPKLAVPTSDRKRAASEGVQEVAAPETKKARLDDEDAMQTELKKDESDSPMADQESEATTPQAEEGQGAAEKERSKSASAAASGSGAFREQPYTYVSPTDPVLLSCLSRLHINPSTFPVSNVLVRNPEGEAARVLYISNDIVKSIIQNNSYERLRLTAAGTKIFAKQEGGKATEAQFRVLGEGLPVVLPFVDEKTIMDGDHESLKILVESYYPLCERLPQPFRKMVEDRPSGSHIVRFPKGTTEITSLTHDLVLPIWKSNVSLTLMIDKKAKSALSLRLFGKDITTAGKERQAQMGQKDSGSATPAVKDETPAAVVVEESGAIVVDESGLKMEEKKD
ncbi:tRNA (cytosine-5-)-methyltransferase [Coprinopsis cinerea okayama7|uniref:tRNA (Cytosine-5-)-methyltransferase n=1 Tax=Coprinopsis cinerea (strain Okayama-7 / 130 / ATCC MYA-4618 / FGSC 9003) TaxID=240176 RepID=A8PC14_COPC7|nr:tRNA (cytosine-5-)-methyltransferase [Coprinopsis cinerea okayama7\|eukprot:XP_001840308.1 tRNA (cytosine-5-)-methyltransferase [Coprinopsis cinerea okayama7\